MLLEIDLPPQARWWVDAARLKQVLINLAGNAVKFTARGHVKVRVGIEPGAPEHAAQDLLRFSVIDTGMGIPADQIDRIFDAFFQVPGTSGKGTGLGLSIAKDLCEAMGGQLRCESTQGVGSRFDFAIWLPRATQAEPSSEALDASGTDAAKTPSCAGALVLVVDDNPVNLLVTQAQLAQLGLTVHCVSSGMSALDWLSSHDPAIVFLDCHMPDMDGFETARALRQGEASRQARRTPIVGLTASVEEAVSADCLAAGMDRVLSKPCTSNTLAAAVRDILTEPTTAPMSSA